MYDFENVGYYVSAIVDECGDVVYYVGDWTQRDIDKVLAEHEEWRERCVYVFG